MNNLMLPEYSSIRAVFGKALAKRSNEAKPECAFLNLLALKSWPLELLEQDCSVYLREIGLVDTERKCRRELLGVAAQSASQFNGVCGDFWSEVAAIRVLATNGYRKFRAIHEKQRDGSTNDYDGYFGEVESHIEVKNIRATETVIDVLHKELQRLYKSEPTEYPFTLRIDYPFDNPPSTFQRCVIRQFLCSLKGRKPGFVERLDLADSIAKLTAVEGEGTAFLMRPFGPDTPEPLDRDRFLAKVRTKAEEARGQMKNEQRLKTLVINFDSPSGQLSEEYIVAGEAVIADVFEERVKGYILLYRSLVSGH